MDPDLSDITTVGGQRIVDAIHAQQDDDVQLVERLANLQQILSSQDEDEDGNGNHAREDENEAAFVGTVVETNVES